MWPVLFIYFILNVGVYKCYDNISFGNVERFILFCFASQMLLLEGLG